MESQAASVKNLLFYIRIIFIHQDFKYFLNLQFYCSQKKRSCYFLKFRKTNGSLQFLPEHRKKEVSMGGGVLDSMKLEYFWFKIIQNFSLLLHVYCQREGGEPIVEVYLLYIITDVQFHTLQTDRHWVINILVWIDNLLIPCMKYMCKQLNNCHWGEYNSIFTWMGKKVSITIILLFYFIHYIYNMETSLYVDSRRPIFHHICPHFQFTSAFLTKLELTHPYSHLHLLSREKPQGNGKVEIQSAHTRKSWVLLFPVFGLCANCTLPHRGTGFKYTPVIPPVLLYGECRDIRSSVSSFLLGLSVIPLNCQHLIFSDN